MVDTSTIPMSARERSGRVRWVLAVILVANVLVAAAKIIVGLATGLASVTADGFHSLIDSGSNVLGLVAISASARPADPEHPYGHEKFEAIAALAIGALIGITMFELARMAIGALVSDHRPEVHMLTVAVIVGTLLINIFVTIYERRAGLALQSPLLLADASHTLSDVFVSLFVLASLLLVHLGYPRADGALALGLLGFVGWVAFGIVKSAVSVLADSARIDPSAIQSVGEAVEGVVCVKAVRSRGMESAIFVDLAIEVGPETTVQTAHALAHRVERAVRAGFPSVVDVVVHVEPTPAPAHSGSGG